MLVPHLFGLRNNEHIFPSSTHTQSAVIRPEEGGEAFSCHYCAASLNYWVEKQSRNRRLETYVVAVINYVFHTSSLLVPINVRPFLLKTLAASLLASIGLLPAQASIHIKPIYEGDQVWTGSAKVSYWNDGSATVHIEYPTFRGCAEAKDYMLSAMASNPPGVGIFGEHKTFNWRDARKLIKELSNSPPLGFMEDGRRPGAGARYYDQIKAIPYPAQAFDCGPRSNPRDRFPDWR